MPKIFRHILILSTLIGSLLIIGCSSVSSSTAANAPRPSAQPITSQSFWQGNSQAIWSRLQYVSIHDLKAARNGDTVNDGWIDLTLISKQDSLNTPKLVQDLMAWRANYPSHPGNSLFPDNNALSALLTTPPPKHIALILPLSGPFARQGQSVRDGFLNAFYSSSSKPAISFADTSSNPDVSMQYQQALDKGADFVIGPLTKDQVKNLMARGGLPVATLALNYTDNASLPANLYQFGLSPLDEAVQLADKAHQAGHSHALIIVSQGDWGQRVQSQLTSRWRSLGGTVEDVLTVTPRMNLTQEVANLLHITIPTETDHKKTQEIQQMMQQERRTDVDVIFLLTTPTTARSVVPLLKYYYAGNIPVYATSSIYAGQRSPQRDLDLAGVIICDTPWTLHGEGHGGRLYAVGRDSYLLSQQLQRLNVMPLFPLYGSTGALTLTPGHQIFRRLPWTKV